MDESVQQAVVDQLKTGVVSAELEKNLSALSHNEEAFRRLKCKTLRLHSLFAKKTARGVKYSMRIPATIWNPSQSQEAVRQSLEQECSRIEINKGQLAKLGWIIERGGRYN